MSVCVCVFQTRRVYIFKYLEVDGEVFKLLLLVEEENET